jgi:phosphoribosyl-ATP pyrophosphohydrolase/phosphoribosyl-AMP cyclohydrolase
MSVELQLDGNGLIPAIAQDAESGEVLMLGYVSPGSLQRTLDGDTLWFYSRSRQELWHKGEVSGAYLHVKSVQADCDGDTLLFKVKPDGPVCHTGKQACFFTDVEAPTAFKEHDGGSGILEELFAVVQDRRRDPPEGSYTAELLASGIGRVAQKVIEEAGESAIAAVEGRTEELAGEVADLFYHALVLLAAADTTPGEVWRVLRERRQGAAPGP